jgi:1,4-alpha-glucan branching enzyme
MAKRTAQQSSPASAATAAPPDGTGLVRLDPWLEPYTDQLRERYAHYRATRDRILAGADSLAAFANGHHYFGLNRGERDGEPGVWYREWAPGALSLALVGDFNAWDRNAHPLTRDEWGIWHLFLPDEQYAQRLTHGSRLKVHVRSAIGDLDRIPAYIRRVVNEPGAQDFTGQYWQPPRAYEWRHEPPAAAGGLKIYEAHVGMATEEERISTYREFADEVLPRVADLGYNAIQLMAIQEHPYYGSFGYQVSNFFAPSSRFGTPEELKHLIDAAHGHGIRVLLDLVHSHAVKNMHEGLNHFDGTGHQYFHPGARGQHPSWDSLLFDYGTWEVLRFLLSNVRYWLEEFRFDGFRFDGVTSMLYHHHGLGHGFSSYDDYFPPHVDTDAVAYLQLANELTHALRPDALTVAEEVSGMVGIARPLDEGGIGFDYRLAMGVPDYWIKLLKHQRDEDWQMDELFGTLVNRRYGEKHIAYAESHDQALVGDKTLAFWLMDAAMYTDMNKTSENLVIDRGIALHKLLRLITFALAGEGYLNFMGNEFGHPEWIDFPRAGNQYSHKYCRRQWSLVDNPELRYEHLNAFDRAMLALDTEFNLLEDPLIEKLQVHEERKLLIFRRGPLVFAFNFHPSASYTDHRAGVPDAADYQLVLDSDQPQFGGFDRLTPATVFPRQETAWDHRQQSVQLYLPSRCALVLAPQQ